jgi:hypothetical protein
VLDVHDDTSTPLTVGWVVRRAIPTF